MQQSFGNILRDAEKARWSLEEVTGALHQLDFGRPFLPDPLVQVAAIDGLGPDGERIGNQIRAHAYLQVFALVERFILPFVMVQAGAAVHGSSEVLLALMQFGEEEAKHITLFERFAEAFASGFGTHCEVVGPAEELAGAVLAEDPLAVALAVLHIEWMTQEHYLRSVRGRPDVEPSFAELLRAHWVEEAQHARIDVILVDELARQRDEGERRAALDAYLRIVDRLDGAFRTQVELDLEAYGAVAGALPEATRDRWRRVQHPAYRDAFLLAGLDHPRFRKSAEALHPEARQALDAASSRLAEPV